MQESHLLICGLGVSKLVGRGQTISLDLPQTTLAQYQAQVASHPSVLLSDPMVHLTEEADIKAKSAGIPGARIHIVSNEQCELQEAGEALTLPQFFTRSSDTHNLGLDVLNLLTELELQEDGVETRPKTGHCAHLVRKKRNPIMELMERDIKKGNGQILLWEIRAPK